MNTKLRTSIAATSLAVLLSPISFALAQPPMQRNQGAPSEVVRYSDLNLSTEAGIRALYRRIQVAAWHVCNEMQSKPVGVESVRCRQSLVDDAVAKVNEPALTALNAGRPLGVLTARR